MNSTSSLPVGGIDPSGADAGHGGAGQPPPDRQRPPETPREPEPKPEPGQRLVIEADRDGIVYTVTNRDTGEVLRRVSRQELMKMGDTANYHAGDLIKDKA